MTWSCRHRHVRRRVGVDWKAFHSVCVCIYVCVSVFVCAQN